MSGVQSARVAYFGKLPACADFIKTSEHAELLQLLDDWLVRVMEKLSANARWKLHYDALPALDFAFLGTRSRQAIAGQLRASADLSQRRFPFLCASPIAVAQPQSFLPLSPLLLAPLWDGVAPLAAQASSVADPAVPLQRLAALHVPIENSTMQQEQLFVCWLEQHHLTTLEALLDQHPLRQLILALGLLLQPVHRSGAQCLDKSLVLPLPQAAPARPLVAAFWLSLIMPFIIAADFELVLFISQQRGRWELVLGFCGAAPETLQAIVDPQCAQEQQIRFDYTGWVDELIAGDSALQKLSAYLQQGRLSLRSVITLFQETLR